MTRLDEIKARAEAATVGPWMEYDSNEGTGHVAMWEVSNDAFHNPPSDEDAPWIAVEIHTGGRADATFVAHARADVPALVEAVGAVLALHSKNKYEACDECFDPSLNNWADLVPYPCPTVESIRTALGEGQQ